MPPHEEDQKRVFVEAVATLVNIKTAMAELLLRPAGVPPSVYGPLVAYGATDAMGARLSKRQIGPLILRGIETRSDSAKIIRAVVEATAVWSQFHLAKDEFAARATVQKAREILGVLRTMEAREAQDRELARRRELERLDEQRRAAEAQARDEEGPRRLARQQDAARQRALLLMQFDELARSPDHQRRGYLLQDLLNRLCVVEEVSARRAFTRNEGGEQIDGAFALNGWHYLVECRWRTALGDIRALDGLMGQVNRSGRQTLGLFLSIEGWSEHVPALLKQNPEKALLLMHGYDLRCILDGVASLSAYVAAMSARLSFHSEPYLSVREFVDARP